MVTKDETKLLIELIQKTGQNTDDKFLSISNRLNEHVTNNKEDFNELKTLLKENITSNRENLNQQLQPMKDLLSKHDEDINELMIQRSNFVKEDLCKLNETNIREYFNKITKRVIYFNLAFLFIYALLLFNSNIVIHWPNIWTFLTSIKDFFF